MIITLKKALPAFATAIAGGTLLACTGTSPSPGAATHQIALPALSESERQQIETEVASKPNREPLQTGIPRDLGTDAGMLRLGELSWRDEGDRETAVVRVRSPEARGMRLGLDLEEGDCPLSFRFSETGNAGGETFSAATVSAAKPLWWSPITRGETSHMHLSRPADAELDACELSIPQISHLF